MSDLLEAGPLRDVPSDSIVATLNGVPKFADCGFFIAGWNARVSIGENRMTVIVYDDHRGRPCTLIFRSLLVDKRGSIVRDRAGRPVPNPLRRLARAIARGEAGGFLQFEFTGRAMPAAL